MIIGKAISPFALRKKNGGGGGGGYDADAQLFFNAQSGAGVTLTTTEKDAVNQSVLDLKTNGLYTKNEVLVSTCRKYSNSSKVQLNKSIRFQSSI